MQFSQLCQSLLATEATTSRLEIARVLSQLWLDLDDTEIWQAANLIQGQLRPHYDQLVFNLSEKMIARGLARLALSEGGLAGGVAVDLFGQADEDSLLDQVTKIQRSTGDWGETTARIHEELFPGQQSAVSISDVYKSLVDLARISGEGSQQAKLDALIALLRQVDAPSSKFIVRMVLGKLRLGFGTMTILDSLSWAVRADKSESKLLESLWQKKADVGLLARAYLAERTLTPEARKAQLMARYQASVGVPLMPALCQRLNSSSDIIEKVGPVIAEPKYDGLRIQIHVHHEDGQAHVAAFTRSLEDATAMFPELTELAAALPVREAILDSEAVGFNTTTHAMLPFQETMSRRRIHDVEAKSQAIAMKFFLFDVLWLDGRELLSVPLRERKQLLTQIRPEVACAQVTEFIETTDPGELRAFHLHQLQVGLEGMVAKGRESSYQSGRKGWNWVKIKEAEGTRGKLNDTLDLVVLGYYYGQGRRHEMGVGAILMGVADGAGNFLTVSKIGTGFTDQNLVDFKNQAAGLTVDRPPASYRVSKELTPDVWLTPSLVAEIAADELTRSSMHTSGYGLRFPRIIRWREDKSAEQATTLTELGQITIDTGD